MVDAGPLVALLHRGDQFHEHCVRAAQALPRPFYTSWPALAEAAWLLRSLPQGLDKLLGFLEGGLVVPLDLDEGAAAWMRKFAAKYADLQPQLADLTLCYLAEREGIATVFSTDRRDFLVFRLAGGRMLTIVPGSE